MSGASADSKANHDSDCHIPCGCAGSEPASAGWEYRGGGETPSHMAALTAVHAHIDIELGKE
ncbi:hypothetical protein GCM10025787_29850 [Saccharopolyspora rosea]